MTAHGYPTARLDDSTLGPLFSLARGGDVEAFEEIVRTIQGPVRAFARRLMRDAHLGDDAAQESFLRMWSGLRKNAVRGRFVAWVFTVTRNTCVELLRRERRTPIPVEIEGALIEPLDGARDLRASIDEAIAGLPEPYRATFLMREFGLAYDEIALALDCPVGTIRSRLHEARRRLAIALRADDLQPVP